MLVKIKVKVMYNDKKSTGRKRINTYNKGVKPTSTSTVPEAYYNRISSNRSITTHHPVWEALKDVLVVKGGHVFVKER